MSQDCITNLGNNQRMLITFIEDFIAGIKKIVNPNLSDESAFILYVNKKNKFYHSSMNKHHF